MLQSDLCDFSNVYIVDKGKVTFNFNPWKVYVNNDFTDERFPDNIFPDGSTTEQTNAARAAAKTAAVIDANNNDTRNLIKGISFRNNAPFIDRIPKISNVLIDNAEYLDVIMPMYNLPE